MNYSSHHKPHSGGTKIYLPSSPSLLTRQSVSEMSFALVAHCRWSCQCFRKSIEALVHSWSSLKESHHSASEVVAVAKQKLCASQVFNPTNTKHMLAIFGQRFGLEICFGHPEAVEQVESGVTSHLRICLTTTEDRTWSFTSYPSEPFLSCTAASILHGSTSNKLTRCLTWLQMKIYNGLISTSRAGELAQSDALASCQGLVGSY